MKLAEALQERTFVNRKLDELRSRLMTNVLVQEGEKPAEDPKELLKEYDACIQRLEHLIASINLTNTKTIVKGKSLTELIARKDALMVKLNAYKDIVYQAGRTSDRARNSEIRILSTVSVKDIQKKIDKLSEEIRLLDNTLQETNWTSDLIEE